MQAADIAWQPLTPGGVAVFARARLMNLLIVQLIIALVAAATVLWFLSSAWFPAINAAIQHLPPGGTIRGGRLVWLGESAVVLAENHFLALTVDLGHQGQARSPAHVQVEFGETNVQVLSLLGSIQYPYPRGRIIAFNREELVPWWGAWSPALLAIAVAGVVACLFVTWFLLAAFYCPAAWLLGFFADRVLSLRAAWRLSGAALMPGALFMTAAILLYGLGVLDVVRLLVAVAIHFLIGWVYLIASPFWCPRHPAAFSTGVNPFDGSHSKQA